MTEPDALRAGPILGAVAATLALGAALAGLAVLLVTRGPAPPPPAPPLERADVEERPFDPESGGARARPPDDWAWVDRARGIARVPADVAAELLLAEEGAR